MWEVGSRDGRDAVELAERIYDGLKEWFWSNADIVCFEANPDQAEIIRTNYSEIEVFELAASNRNSTAQFRVYHGDEGAVGSSSLNLDWKGDELEGHNIEVETKRLDSIITDEIIDIMKIDVEGYSLQVLQGIGEKLNQIRVMHIETETWYRTDKKVEDYLKVRGWTLVDVSEQYGGMPDQVWLNSNLAG